MMEKKQKSSGQHKSAVSASHLTSLLCFSRVLNQLIYFLSDACSIV
jgi:hypothetical protein